MTTLLTFLGIANYSKTRYVLADQRHESRYCPAAIAHFVRPPQVLVVVTQAAKTTHFEDLAEEIATFSKPRAIQIPDGHTEDDLWTIFDALTDQIEAGTELVVDITYGFRSLPFLSFLALTFLQVAKNVKVKAVYYGAWEARNQETNETPVFDLTPFVTLLDWTLATDQFLATGDTASLADRLSDAHQVPWRSQSAGRKVQAEMPRRLQSVSNTLGRMGQALRLARPEQVMSLAHTLQGQLQEVRSEVGIWAKPFNLLLDRAANDYARLGLGVNARAPENAVANLERQRQLVDWYVARRQYVQAIILAREWVVSYTLYLFGWHVIESRSEAEDMLNTASKVYQRDSAAFERSTVDDRFVAAVRVWTKLPDLRNDIAHAGMRKQPRSEDSIVSAAREVAVDLSRLPLNQSKGIAALSSSGDNKP